MNYFRVCSIALAGLICFAGNAISAKIDVDLSDPDYYRPFSTPELVAGGSGYQADFTDIFTFTLAKKGALSLTLSEKDNHGFFEEWVSITSVQFTDGPAPSLVTKWKKEDPYFDQSNLASSFAWNSLDAGIYHLAVTGSAYASNYPATHYWMKSVKFKPSDTTGNPHLVPEPATMVLAGLGLLGIAGFSRVRRRK